LLNELENSKKLLVIGGSGFFGKSILDSFQRGRLNRFFIAQVIVIARNANKLRDDYPELVCENVELISGDISLLDNIPFADIVVHAASSTNKMNYILDSESQKENIENATNNYCKLAKLNHNNSKIVYCSSGAVYGQQLANVDKITEGYDFTDIRGLSIEKRNYALGKRNSEDSFIQLGREGLSVSIARCFAFYGKYLPRDQHFAYGNFIGKAERGEAIEVNAKNPVYRSYMSADDLVDALIIIALNSNESCPIYNVGSDRAILIHDLAIEIAAEYGVSYIMNEITEWDNVDRYVPDTTKLNDLVNKFEKKVC